MRPQLPQSDRAFQRQCGSIVVPAAFAILVGIVVLWSAQMGYLFFMKRALQNAADVAALSAVQVLGAGQSADCTRAIAAGKTSAVANVPVLVDTLLVTDVTVQCMVWDSARTSSSGMHVFAPVGSQLPNAVLVSITKSLRPIMPSIGNAFNTQTTVTAVARNTAPSAAFTVGSQLLSLSGGLLANIASTAGATPAQLNVLNAAGLASVNITPSGLLQALGLPLSVAAGVGTPSQLAALNSLTLGQLLQATSTVLGQSGTGSADVGLLSNAIGVLTSLGSLNVPISLFGANGVFQLVGDTTAALQANVNARQVIETAVALANGQNLLTMSASVPLLGVQANLRIVEPPVLAIGGIGVQAKSAGVRLYLRVQSSSIPGVGPLLGLLGTQIDLPIILNVAQSTGTLSNLCAAPLAKDQAQIAVTASVSTICVGTFPSMSTAAAFMSATNSCDAANFAAIQPRQLVTVLGLLTLNTKITLGIFKSAAPVSVTLNAPPSANSSATVSASTISIAQMSTDLSNALIGSLVGVAATPLSAALPQQLAQGLVGATGSGQSITAVANSLSSMASALQQLGASLQQGGLVGGLGGTLQLVGSALTGLVVAPLNDTLCLANVTPTAIRQCRVNGVNNLLLSGANQVNSVSSLLLAALQPVVSPLNQLLNNLLSTLGLNLGQTHVSLLSVQCGKPELMY